MALATDRVLLVVLIRSNVRAPILDLLTRRKELLSGQSTPASFLVVDHDQEGQEGHARDCVDGLFSTFDV